MSAIPTRSDARRAAMPWVTLAVLASLAFRAGGAERGYPLVTVYPAEQHKAGPQTFDLAQDARGMLYFGNLHGLLSYDGAWWRLMKLPDDQVSLSVAADGNGRVAVGLVGDLGYLAVDENGSQQYRSLLPQIAEEKRDFGDVRAICATKAGFLYVTETMLLLWNGAAPRIVADLDPETAPRGCFADEQGIFLRGPNGLQQLEPATGRIAPTGLDAHVFHVRRASNGKLIAAVRDEGLFLVEAGVATPFAPAASEWLKGKLVTGGSVLRDGRIVFTTRQHGLIILDPDGTIEQIMGEDAGLPDAVITESLVDREGSLWLAMEGPIVRVDVASPVTVYDTRSGLRGSAGDVAMYRGELYAASTHGVYRIGKTAHAERVGTVEQGAWRLLPLDDEMLVATMKGIFRIDGAGEFESVVATDNAVYDVFRSTSDPSRVWLAQADGLGSIRRTDSGWESEPPIAGVPRELSSLVERDGVLWVGSVFNGILRIDDPRGPRQTVRQFGAGEMNVFDVGGRTVFVKADGTILEINAAGQLVPDRLLGHITAPRGFFVVEEDARGDIWINSTPPRVFERQPDGTYEREGKPLVAVTAADIQTMRAMPNGAVWFAGDRGLFRYQPAERRTAVMPQPAPLIRRIVVGENRLLLDGTAADAEPPELRHNFGRIRIEFAPASYRPGVAYQYRLDPIDEGWSEWSDQPFIDYTTLEANDYTFRLRARGPAMVPSGETRWTFSVLSPWYRTQWAYAVWLLLAGGMVAAVIRVRTGSLQRQAERLRARVAEQTGELQQTVKLLEVANAQLEAMSLEDDLTGIANRRYFDRALADEWNRARRYNQPLALILLDLDNFKDLNDRRGHPAGDDCLRRVGAFLSQAIRRSGEVVARYGGEEFAILLPGADADTAVQVAESLREGIERLGIPYGNGTGQRVTGSCGVAAVTPGADVTSDTLVAGADRALYAAKHSGRNCVRVADETTTGTWLRDVSLA